VKGRILLTAAALVTVALSLTIATAFGASGRLSLYLVNSGPDSNFYNVTDANGSDCPSFTKPASLAATNTGSGVQYDSPGYAFAGSSDQPSRFSYIVPAGGDFTVRASSDAVILKLWAFSGNGTCRGQGGAQAIDWRVYCTGTTCGTDVSLTGAGQLDKPGWQAVGVPAGTPTNTLFNNHAGPSSAVEVGAGDVITLELSADTWAGIQWSARNGAGVSSLSILRT
jgi:hypothetical protein